MARIPTEAEIDAMSEDELQAYLASVRAEDGQATPGGLERAEEAEAVPAWRRATGSSRSYALLLVVASLIGIAASWELIVSELRIIREPLADLTCDINPLVSCGDTFNVWQGNLLGVPNSFVGAIAFGALAAIGLVLLSGARLPRWMWWGLSAGSLGGIAFVIWFLSVSIMTFGKLCPFCMVIWSVTIPVAAHSWAWAAAGGHLGLRDNLALDVLKARWWITAAMYLAVVLTIVIAFGGQLARLFG